MSLAKGLAGRLTTIVYNFEIYCSLSDTGAGDLEITVLGVTYFLHHPYESGH